MAHVALDGEENAELNEYISCIERSDAELKDFMDKLRLLDRPVVLCFFGDHQPGFVEWLSSEAFEADQMPEIELVQNRYVTPYMIWTNDAQLRGKAGANPPRSRRASTTSGQPRSKPPACRLTNTSPSSRPQRAKCP